ncbi:GDSL-type esterase/lipase family protein [Streptomyces hoynatensis]|uniref:G-D-S-L family lipolytic protein n=1 Tax=Streptomyces hoynatensis TaxID=1141874 RepID=A0A3A9YCI6_9ACTN|nr:GDSL-type esterase/lipase family protein [Streptomyces hoynatensis]RKN34960.1 G-D-S-L family lipolytic protein [Streptomyces hoynatensis]
MPRDLRVCFVGDSYLAGVGDPGCLGWAGRLAALAHAEGHPLTAYHLGVRRDTSAGVLARFVGECTPRLREAEDPRVVLSFGVNDATAERGRTRVAPKESVANLGRLLGEAATRGWRVLVAGPPPVAEAAHAARTARLDEEFARVCRDRAVPYVPVHASLLRSAVWMREVREGDGAHPGAAGYGELAARLAPHWRAWLSGPA